MRFMLPILLALAIFGFGSCAASGPGNAKPPADQATPSNKLTVADVAKLKWLEGTWKGTNDETAFYERYRFENGTTLVVESFADETLTNVSDTSRFTLVDGEFGHTEAGRRTAASEITADHVRFVPVTGGGGGFSFERLDDGTWQAVLDTKGSTNKKVYHMVPFAPSNR